MNKQTAARILLISLNVAIPLIAVMPITLGSTESTLGAVMSVPFLLLVAYFVASTAMAFRAHTPADRLRALSVHAGVVLLTSAVGLASGLFSAGGVFSLVLLSVIYVPLWLAATEPAQELEPVELFPDETQGI